jgi:hypothetical protein
MPASEALEPFANKPLADIARLAAEQRALPVERWNPPHRGHSGIRIGRDGSWIHEGRPIRRPEMVRLFARVLRREPGGGYVLVTPGEKLDIDVDDAPFVAIEVASDGVGPKRTLAFRTNVGEIVVAGPDHPIRIEPNAAGPRPSLIVRDRLEALIARPVFYELAELAIAEGGDPPGLWSEGRFFALGEPA